MTETFDLPTYMDNRHIRADLDSALPDVLAGIQHIAVQQALASAAGKINDLLQGGSSDLALMDVHAGPAKTILEESCRGLDPDEQALVARDLTLTFETALHDALWKDMSGSLPLEDDSLRDSPCGHPYNWSFKRLGDLLVRYFRKK